MLGFQAGLSDLKFRHLKTDCVLGVSRSSTGKYYSTWIRCCLEHGEAARDLYWSHLNLSYLYLSLFDISRATMEQMILLLIRRSTVFSLETKTAAAGCCTAGGVTVSSRAPAHAVSYHCLSAPVPAWLHEINMARSVRPFRNERHGFTSSCSLCNA